MNKIIKKLGSFFLAVGIMTATVSNVSALDGRSNRFDYNDKTNTTRFFTSIYYGNKCVANHYTIWNNAWYYNTLASDIEYKSHSNCGVWLQFKAGVSAGGAEYRFSDWIWNDNWGVAEASVKISNSTSGSGSLIAYWE